MVRAQDYAQPSIVAPAVGPLYVASDIKITELSPSLLPLGDAPVRADFAIEKQADGQTYMRLEFYRWIAPICKIGQMCPKFIRRESVRTYELPVVGLKDQDSYQKYLASRDARPMDGDLEQISATIVRSTNGRIHADIKLKITTAGFGAPVEILTATLRGGANQVAY